MGDRKSRVLLYHVLKLWRSFGLRYCNSSIAFLHEVSSQKHVQEQLSTEYLAYHQALLNVNSYRETNNIIATPTHELEHKCKETILTKGMK